MSDDRDLIINIERFLIIQQDSELKTNCGIQNFSLKGRKNITTHISFGQFDNVGPQRFG